MTRNAWVVIETMHLQVDVWASFHNATLSLATHTVCADANCSVLFTLVRRQCDDERRHQL